MKTFEYKELYEYIMKQPDDKVVNMSSGSKNDNDSCCCVMSQFLRDNNIEFLVVHTNGRAISTLRHFVDIARIDLPVNYIWDIFSNDDTNRFWSDNLNTFKQLKDNIKPKYHVTETH